MNAHTERIERALHRAAASDGIFIRTTPDRARSAEPKGAIADLPYVVKDVFDVAGTPTTAASRSRDAIAHAGRDAVVVSQLTSAGAPLIGKVTLSELAYSGLGINRRFGTPTRAIGGVERLAGGSSSGSAGAVAAGIVPFALGTDTSGSSRVPAAWSGVLGFRPSEGRYSTDGLFALAPTLDTVGLFARDPDVLKRVDGVLDPDGGSVASRTVPTLVIPEGALLDRCTPLVREQFTRAVRRFAAAGWAIATARVPAIEEARALLDSVPAIVDVEAADRFGYLLQAPDLLEPFTVRRLTRAVAAAASPLAHAAVQAMGDLRRRFAVELGDRILLTPAVEVSSPSWADVADPAAEDALNARALRITMTLSYLNAPGVSVPCPAVGPDVGILLSAAPGRDRALLEAVTAAWHVLADDSATTPENDYTHLEGAL